MLLYDEGEYRASENWPYAISAGCVVYRYNEGGSYDLLLLSRDYAHNIYSAGDTSRPSYHLPKGHVNFNESLEAAAMRETEEEIGAEVELTGYLGCLKQVFDHPRDDKVNDKVIHYFAASWRSDTEKTDNEHDGREWASLTKAEELLGQPNPKGEDEIIRRLKKFLELTSAT
jgi:ADP-ribose pyrophosphatase YjhB (NUDIX family)